MRRLSNSAEPNFPSLPRLSNYCRERGNLSSVRGFKTHGRGGWLAHSRQPKTTCLKNLLKSFTKREDPGAIRQIAVQHLQFPCISNLFQALFFLPWLERHLTVSQPTVSRRSYVHLLSQTPRDLRSGEMRFQGHLIDGDSASSRRKRLQENSVVKCMTEPSDGERTNRP